MATSLPCLKGFNFQFPIVYFAIERKKTYLFPIERKRPSQKLSNGIHIQTMNSQNIKIELGLTWLGVVPMRVFIVHLATYWKVVIVKKCVSLFVVFGIIIIGEMKTTKVFFMVLLDVYIYTYFGFSFFFWFFFFWYKSLNMVIFHRRYIFKLNYDFKFRFFLSLFVGCN